MKAICISDDFPIAKALGNYVPTCGETIEVVGIFHHPKWGEYYFLEQGPSDFGYDANKFVLGEEIEEFEVTQKELVNA